MSQVSTVPNRREPCSRALRTEGTSSRSHFNLTPEKYVEIGKPVTPRRASMPPNFSWSAWDTYLVRASCHKIQSYNASPVFESQQTVDSL